MDALRAKFGPFPVWIWLALITALGLTYYLYERRKNPAAASTADMSGTGQVPEVVSQDTINVSVPPEAPEPKAPGVGSTKPPPPFNHASGTPDYRQLAIDALKDKGIKNPTPQQIADEQNDIRETVGLGKAKGTPPPGGGTDVGVLPPTHHGQHRHVRPPKRHVPPRKPLPADRAA